MPPQNQRESLQVSFEGWAGHRLVGRLECPSGTPVVFALFAHCFGCSKDSKAAFRISRALAEHQIAALRFDFTGLGESEGEFAATTFASNVEDVLAAARFLQREYQSPTLLVGHSLGGLAVILAAQQLPSANIVSSIAAPSNTECLRRTLLEHSPGIATTVVTEVRLMGQLVRVSKDILDGLVGNRIQEAVETLGRSLLVFHSPVDDVVGIDHAERLYGWAQHPKSLVALPGADHLLVDGADATFIGHVLAAYVGRHADRKQ